MSVPQSRDGHRGRPWTIVLILLSALALVIGLVYGMTWLGGNDLATQVAVFANALIAIIAFALCWRYRR